MEQIKGLSDVVVSQDAIGILIPRVVQDRGRVTPRWSIHRYVSRVFEGEALPFFREQADYLILAAQALNRGQHELWSKYMTKAEMLMGKGEHCAFGVSHIAGNLQLNEGINLFTTLLCGGAGTAFNTANSYIGVGDSATAEAASQTGLSAATNKLYVAVDSGFPTYGTSQQAAWKSTFTTAQANFAWNEFTVANGNSDSATNLNRKVSSQGTKQSGQTWVPTLTIIWS